MDEENNSSQSNSRKNFQKNLSHIPIDKIMLYIVVVLLFTATIFMTNGIINQ